MQIARRADIGVPRIVASVALSSWFFARKRVAKLWRNVWSVTVNLIPARRAASDTIPSWGDLGVQRLGVVHPHLRYEARPATPGHSLAEVWRLYSKPADRPAYTAASSARQDALIRRRMPPALVQERVGWLTAVRERGLLAGTLDYLVSRTGEQHAA